MRLEGRAAARRPPPPGPRAAVPRGAPTLALGIVAWAVLANGAEVGELDLASGFVIEGAAAFTPDRIRGELFADADVILCAHPRADRRKFLDTVKAKVLSGYRHHGFLDVRVTAQARADGAIAVAVAEGRRYRFGRVRFEGNRAADAGRIEECIARAHASAIEKGARPDPGSGAFLDAVSLKAVREGTKDAYGEEGYLLVELSTEPVARDDGQIADLVVRIEDEGPLCRLMDIEMPGASPETVDRALRYTGLARNEVVTDDLFDAAWHGLWLSGRFATIRLEKLPVPGGMRIQVLTTPNEKAPPFDPAPTAADRLVGRFAKWASGYNEDKEAVDLHLEAGNGSQAALAPRGGLAMIARDVSAFLPVDIGSVSLVWSQDTVLVAFPDRRIKWTVPRGDLQLRVSLSVSPPEPGDEGAFFSFTTGVEVRSGEARPGDAWPVRVHPELDPGTVLALARAGELEEGNGTAVATLIDRGPAMIFTMRVHRETGRFEGLVAQDAQTGETAATLKLAAGAFAGLRHRIERQTRDFEEMYGAAGTGAAVAGIASHILAGRSGAQSRDEARRLCSRIGATLSGPVDAALRRFGLSGGAAADWTPEFHIPRPCSPVLADEMLTFVTAILWQAAHFFERGSWPRVLLREAAFVASRKTEHTRGVLLAALESDELGPLANYCFYRALMLVDPGSALSFATKGSSLMDAERFSADCEPLLAAPDVAELAHALALLIAQTPGEDVDSLGALIGFESPETIRTVIDAVRDTPRDDRARLTRTVLEQMWRALYRDMIASGFASAYMTIGRQNMAQRNAIQALRAFDRAIDLAPRDGEAFFGRGMVYLGGDRNRDALRDFERAIELAPRFAGGYLGRGVALARFGKRDEAKADLLKAIELQPNGPIARDARSLLEELDRAPEGGAEMTQ